MSKVVWVARAFLDYRAAVVEELIELYGRDFYLIISSKWMPKHITERLKISLGENLIILDNELTIGTKNFGASMANSKFRLPIQPGLLKTLKKIKPTVIIGDGFFQWSFYGYLYKLFNKCKIVICYERTRHTERNSQWYRNLYRKLMVRYTDSFCCNGQLSSEYLNDLGVPSKSITTGYMVHEQKKPLVNKSFSLKEYETQKVFLFVGQLVTRKGVEILVNEWAKDIKNLDCKLVLVGDGELKMWINETIMQENITNIQLIGTVEHKLIPQYYNACDVVIMPTLEDNWSLVVPEAMSYSKPVITTIFNGCHPELINKDTGITVNPLSEGELSIAITKFNEKTEEELTRMGKSSFDIVKVRDSASAAKAIIKAIKISREN